MTTVEKLDALAEVVDLVDGRVDGELVRDTRQLLAHASRRLAAGPQTTVALAGATGSGKSSLFNALSGTRLAEQGVRRPTTSKTLAVSFTATNPDLLDLIGVERRREAKPPIPGLTDVVLLDLPDHDSFSGRHRDEVDRMVGLVDQFIWVLDPQKYADAAIHQRYLRPLARHRDVITVVLNQADLLPPDQLEQCLAHIRRLLDADGLHGVPLLATSALTGMGVDDLRERLVVLAGGKRAAAQRLAADVAVAASRFDPEVGHGPTGKVEKETVSRLNAQLSAAAGVPVVVDAVRDSVRYRGQLATGWPLVKWLGRLRPDPLKRLRLGGPEKTPGEAPVLTRSSLPPRSVAADAHLATGLRAFSQELGEGMTATWSRSITAVVHAATRGLPDELDRAVVAVDLKVARPPIWWGVIRALQWLLIAAVVVGLGWLTVNGLLGYFGLPGLGMVPIGPEGGFRVPLPTILSLGGLLAGVLLSVCSQLIIGATALDAARRARKSLDAAVAEVARSRIVAPAEAEMARYVAARKALDRILH
ncbi:50S ribosome-binding GTPase [Tessaracoccus bendigoensis DSM 12906]|uniref:50S ribosome-binding GTPase n=1 Tax=Tessaracoccus bendigoensis DSM 12906 TaxID=1123357 RepID=A0A1M6DDP9_9ACTN|nr:GTPase [Tessaracoccus bendigoensis]SHI71332.1 50S ribosome-binding GTPase [Tessaracoccus bendigoensis DSM 12906]